MAGTLAIDLGSSSTVVAYQPPGAAPSLLPLPPYSLERPAVIPSMLWLSSPDSSNPLVGRQVIEAGLARQGGPQLHRDFKRLIGSNTRPSDAPSWPLSPEASASLLLQRLWQALPADLEPERLVLTAPIETYPGYRRWLLKACQDLAVPEVALVDEPTAAAIGAGLPAGSLVLVVDMGGGTTDLSLVRLEGGEGKAMPIAQLLRFAGRDLSSSRQALRCASVIGKAGVALGGRDIDRWIVHALAGSVDENALGDPALLEGAETLKCSLSAAPEWQVVITPKGCPPLNWRLKSEQLDTLLMERGLLRELDALFEQVLAAGRRAGVSPRDFDAVLAVGGGSHLRAVRQWLSRRCPEVPFHGDRPVEAVALGALSLTPGVRVRDVLSHGVSLRCWDRRSGRHHWHPLFVAGQSWPTEQPLELVLASSVNGQSSLELVLGEPLPELRAEVVFRDGLPVLRPRQAGEAEVSPWPVPPEPIPLEPQGVMGVDRLRLRFRIDRDCRLMLGVTDLLTGDVMPERGLNTIR